MVKSLSSYFEDDINNELDVPLIECVFLSIRALYAKNSELAIECLEFLHGNLEHDKAQVRLLAFTGLVSASECFSIQSESFIEWCDNKLNQLSELVGVKFEKEDPRLDLLYVVVSLNHVDPYVFKDENTTRDIWPRELLISNLFKQLDSIQTEQLEFYQMWLQIEEREKNRKNASGSIVLLIHINLNISIFKSMSELNELVFILTQYDSDLRLETFNIDEICVFLKRGLKEVWCIRLIEKAMKNSENLDRTFLEQLSASICARFDANFIHRLFNSIALIDDLKAFESLLDFCSTPSGDHGKKTIRLDDVWLRNLRCSTTTEFRNLLQVKHLCDNFASTKANREQMGIMFGLILDMINKKEDPWTFEQLSELILAIKSREHVKHSAVESALDLLRVIAYYELSSLKYAECLEIFKETDPLKNLNVFVVANKFQQKVKFSQFSSMFYSYFYEIKYSNDLKFKIQTEKLK